MTEKKCLLAIILFNSSLTASIAEGIRSLILLLILPAWYGDKEFSDGIGTTLLSEFSKFTELTGFVHPEDKLVSNMFVYIQAITTILMLGVLYPSDPVLQERLFNVSAMIVIAYVFLFVFIFFSAEITEGSEMGQVKEMTSRFMLVSLFLGGIMAGIKIFLDWVWDITDSYGLASIVLAIFAVVLVFGIVAYLGRRYEPVGE